MASTWFTVAVVLLAVFCCAGAQEGCDCDDVAPSSEFTCEQQKEFGKCEESWVIDSGYCRLTCGKCSCNEESGEEQGGEDQGGESSKCDCPDVAPPGDFTCEDQASWGKCGESWLVDGGFCQGSCCSCPDSSEPVPADPAPSSSEACDCDDVQPAGDYSCADQASWGKCGDEWMISGNFCAKTCDRCQCPEEAASSTEAASSDEATIPVEEASMPDSEDEDEDSGSDKVLFDAEENMVVPKDEPTPASEVEEADAPASESSEVSPSTDVVIPTEISTESDAIPSSETVVSPPTTSADVIDPITEEDEEGPAAEADSGP